MLLGGRRIEEEVAAKVVTSEEGVGSRQAASNNAISFGAAEPRHCLQARAVIIRSVPNPVDFAGHTLLTVSGTCSGFFH